MFVWWKKEQKRDGIVDTQMKRNENEMKRKRNSCPQLVLNIINSNEEHRDTGYYVKQLNED